MQDVSFPAGRLTVTVAGAPVNEIVFADAAGRALPLGSVSAGGEALFDEQTTLPDRPSQLNGMYFDEIYHGRTGYETLHGLPIYETTHPPLGKDFIALGIALLGMNPLGWRIMGVLFGIAMVPVFYLLARRLLKKFWPVLCVTGLFALDFMRYTQSRIATIDVFVVLFVLLGAYFMLWFCQAYVAGGRKGALLPAALGGVAFGLGCASKWTGVYAGLGLAAVYFLALYGRWRHILSAPGSEADKEITFQRDFRFAIRTGLLFYVAVPLAIYTASYIPLLFEQSGGFTFAGILRSQQVMFSYHSQLTSTHPFESRWYSWPLMLRPVWYYMGSRLPAGTVASIAAFGNPVVWWGGAAAPCSGWLCVFSPAAAKKAGRRLSAHPLRRPVSALGLHLPRHFHLPLLCGHALCAAGAGPFALPPAGGTAQGRARGLRRRARAGRRAVRLLFPGALRPAGVHLLRRAAEMAARLGLLHPVTRRIRCAGPLSNNRARREGVLLLRAPAAKGAFDDGFFRRPLAGR